MKLIVGHKQFRTDTAAVIRESYARVQTMVQEASRKGQINAQLSGATTTVCVHFHDNNKLVMSHVGDSRAVLIKRNAETGQIQSMDLTIDHKPELREEKQYIEQHGGRVAFDGFANHRVYVRNGTYPGLNMSRALGDLLGSQNAGINNQPDIKEIILGKSDFFGRDDFFDDVDNDAERSGSKGKVASKDRNASLSTNETDLQIDLPKLLDDGTRAILLICSDGVWEFIESREAKEIAVQYDRKNARDCAEVLAKEAWDRWIREEGGIVVDDITALAIYI